MAVLSDADIRQRIKIKPFSEGIKRPGVISYGLSSAGYDLRLGRVFKIFNPLASYPLVNPKNMHPDCLVHREGDFCDVPGNSYILAEVMEWIEMPDDVIGICLGKSTLARVGVIVNCTPIEPMWRGVLTVEISNSSPLPVRLCAGEGICQVVFHELTCRPEKTYADKGGKYQDQPGLTLPKVD